MKKLFFTLALLISTNSFAQQTIFNVPSADITEKNKNFLQHESQFRTKDPEKFWNVTNYYARGIGHNTEIDVTQFNLSNPSSDDVSIGAGFKSAINLPLEGLKKYQPKIIVGALAPVSLRGNGIGYFGYSSASFFVPQSGSRFTAGIASGSKEVFRESVNCFIGGFEQKLTDKLSFINDWYSGHHYMGIFASGFSYAAPQNFTIYTGLQFPNSDKVGRNSFVIEVARIF